MSVPFFYHLSFNMLHFPGYSLPIFYGTAALYTLFRQPDAENEKSSTLCRQLAVTAYKV